MIKNVIRHDDKIYIIDRKLPSSTTEESANRIHNVLGTDALLRNQHGDWFCCNVVKDAEFRDIDSPQTVLVSPPPSPEDYGHYGLELQDHGGMG